MVTRLKQIVSSFRNRLYRFIRFRISKRTAIIIGGLVGVIALVGGGTIAYAGPNAIGFGVETMLWIFNTIIFYLAYFFGYLAMKVFGLVVWVASYQGFIDNKAVSQGWYLVRDTMNMFFVIILLVIAFATILRVEKYEIKKMLPAVIKAAILVNFSKLICGIIIDIGQVVMLTFVAGFAQSAGGNLAVGIGIDKIMAAKNSGTEAKGIEEHHYTVILLTAVVLTFVALIVMTVMLAMLVTRIVAIWFYVVISPLAFVMKVVPFTAKYADQWWSKFGWYVAIGPVMAFFLWLSLLTMSDPQGLREGFDPDGVKATSGDDIVEAGDANTPAILTQDVFTQYVVAIGLLWMSVYVAQEAGGTIGQIASKISSKGLNLGKAGLKLAGSPISNRVGAMKEGFKARLADNKQRKMAVWKERGGKAGGAVERTLDYANAPVKGIKTLVAAGKSAVSQVGISKADGRKGKDVAKDTVKAFFRGAKKELGSIDPMLKVSEDQAAQAAHQRKIKDATEYNKARGIVKPEQRLALLSDSTASKAQRTAAGIEMGAKDELKDFSQFSQILKLLENNREGTKTFKDSVKKNHTDFLYMDEGGNFKDDKIHRDIENDELDLLSLPSKVTANADFMKVALPGLVNAKGAKAAGEIMAKISAKGFDQKAIIEGSKDLLSKDKGGWVTARERSVDNVGKQFAASPEELSEYTKLVGSNPAKAKEYLNSRSSVQEWVGEGLNPKDKRRLQSVEPDKQEALAQGMIDAIHNATFRIGSSIEGSFLQDGKGDAVASLGNSGFKKELREFVPGMTATQLIDASTTFNDLSTQNEYVSHIQAVQFEKMANAKDAGALKKTLKYLEMQKDLLKDLQGKLSKTPDEQDMEDQLTETLGKANASQKLKSVIPAQLKSDIKALLPTPKTTKKKGGTP
jgi:hypothetical protein